MCLLSMPDGSIVRGRSDVGDCPLVGAERVDELAKEDEDLSALRKL